VPDQDTRSRDGRATLLQYLARRLAAAQPPAPDLASELPSVVSPALKTSLLVPLWPPSASFLRIISQY
jgi:hypothetical protein